MEKLLNWESELRLKLIDHLFFVVHRVTSRRKQNSTNEEKHNEIRELEKTCEQLRKVNAKEFLYKTSLVFFLLSRLLIMKH